MSQKYSASRNPVINHFVSYVHFIQVQDCSATSRVMLIMVCLPLQSRKEKQRKKIIVGVVISGAVFVIFGKLKWRTIYIIEHE